jgi:hypothetical protein
MRNGGGGGGGLVGEGKLIFLLPRAAAIYIDFGATSDVS